MRKKKEFPVGTFIPFPKRLLAILQLCIAFSIILSYASQPFMGEYFSLKSDMLLYEYVTGNSTLLKSPEQKDKLARNANRFALLPEHQLGHINRNYQKLYDYSTRPFLSKITDGLRALVSYVPSFEQAWIIFSVLIAVFLLLKIEGAARAAWLLPIIVLAYGIDNRLNGNDNKITPDVAMIPTEDVIVKDFLKEPLNSGLEEQHTQLKKGWEKYLATTWNSENKLENKSWDQLVEEGEFNFNLARLEKRPLNIPTNWIQLFNEKKSYFILIIFFLWNLYFAWMVNRSVKDKKNDWHDRLTHSIQQSKEGKIKSRGSFAKYVKCKNEGNE
ncbi:MAG: hypothetical protein H0W88_09960 [Parachlamydiaceae bacterium]|nr:hypothetical protein [Parachlamydiaceae bacterium]